MTSIAQILIDKEHGITHESAPAKTKRQPVAPLTEEQVNAKEAMRNALRVGVWTVEFIKMNGQPATMECTLDPRLLPTSASTTSGKSPSGSDHLLHVYAVDRQGWRSFATPNVTKFYKSEEQ